MSHQNFLEKNLSYFPPVFQEKILALKSPSSSDIAVETSKSGEHVPRHKGKYIHSKYDPGREAMTFCRKYSELDHEALVVFGFGFGYHVEELRRLNPRIDIIVYELVPEMLREAFRHRDFSPLFEAGNINIVAEGELNSFVKAFQATHESLIQEKSCQIIIHPQAVGAAPPEFQKVVNALEIIEMGRKQPQLFNKIESKNIYENAEIISRSIGIATLRKRFEQLPALVVGAGPSLDNTLPYLVQHKEKFIVIAVDAAVTALINEGIRPDFIVSVDPQDAVLRHLASHLNETIPMFATPIAYHRLLSKYQGEKIFLSQEESPFLQQISSLKGLGTTKAGSSVTCFSIDIALQLGCGRVFMTGVDSSFPGKMAYAKKTKLNVNHQQYIAKKKVVETDDIFFGKVLTHQNLYDYLRTIELQIKTTTTADFFLIGSIGARIEGARSIHQRHVQSYTGSTLSKSDLLRRSLFQSGTRNDALYREIRTVAEASINQGN